MYVCESIVTLHCTSLSLIQANEKKTQLFLKFYALTDDYFFLPFLSFEAL